MSIVIGQRILSFEAFRQRSRQARAREFAVPSPRAACRVSSFDVFDTLITRVWFQPTDLFLAIGRELKERGLFDGSEAEWQAIRVGAERRCAVRRGKNEATLDNIYADIALECGWTPEQEHLAKILELNAEVRALRPIAQAVERLRAHRSQIPQTILLSDTYFSATVLRHMLSRCGINCSDDELFCSSSHDATKREGRLFDIVAKRLGAQRSEIMHLGDNALSDVLKPRQLGVEAALFMDAEPSRYEKDIYAAKSGSVLAKSAIAGCARTARLRQNLSDAHLRTIWETSANVAGPLLTGFVLWTLIEARQKGNSTLYYLARDGQILQRIAEALVKWLQWPIECRYLMASRKALFLPSLASDPENVVARILERNESADVAATSALLGFDIEAEARGGEIRNTRAALTTRELLESCRPRILADARQQKEALRRYLMQEGFNKPAATPMLVDIGWHGNLQLHLSRTIENDAEMQTAADAMSGLYFGLAGRPPRIADRMATFAPFKRWLNASLLETFCSADHGTVVGYAIDPNSGKVSAQLAAEKNEALLQWGLGTQQRGIMAFVEDLTSGHTAASFDAVELMEELRASSLRSLKRLVLSPSPAEASCYGTVKHAVDAGHSESAEIAPAYTMSQAARTLIYGARDRAGLWAEGSMTRRASTEIERQALLSLWSLRRMAVELSKMALGVGQSAK
ncbi:MAG TPA: HAD family hydrolase [Hyphomicrobium sp.]|nr:HAD family hydrolase [Hyphomicrobium sp.]